MRYKIPLTFLQGWPASWPEGTTATHAFQNRCESSRRDYIVHRPKTVPTHAPHLFLTQDSWKKSGNLSPLETSGPTLFATDLLRIANVTPTPLLRRQILIFKRIHVWICAQVISHLHRLCLGPRRRKGSVVFTQPLIGGLCCPFFPST